MKVVRWMQTQLVSLIPSYLKGHQQSNNAFGQGIAYRIRGARNCTKISKLWRIRSKCTKARIPRSIRIQYSGTMQKWVGQCHLYRWYAHFIYAIEFQLSETTLSAQLKMKGITDIYVCGLAYDVCVGATAVDAISSGYRTILLDDCCRGVDLKDIENVKETVVSTNGVIVTSKEVSLKVDGISFQAINISFHCRWKRCLRDVIDVLNLATNLQWNSTISIRIYRNGLA